MRDLDRLMRDLEASEAADESSLIDLSTEEAKVIAGSIAQKLSTLKAGEREALITFLDKVHESLKLHELQLTQGMEEARGAIDAANSGERACLSYNRTMKLN